MDGAIQEVVHALREAGLDLAAEIEARLDHPDDDLSHATDAAVIDSLNQLAERAERVAAGWRAGRLCLHGAIVGIVGAVNAGKSSLFNRLVGQVRALVSDQPGTTRDVVEQRVAVDGLSITYLDTAGERATQDALERAGIALGRTLTEGVDLLIVVCPLHTPVSAITQSLLDRTAETPRLVVGTHLDCATAVPEYVDHAVSNTSGEGVAELVMAIRSALGAEPPSGAEVVLLSQRQHALFAQTGDRFRAAGHALGSVAGPAVAAGEVLAALEQLGALEGRDTREDVLDRLFSRFCIGK
jgi:tRNA modification GTPase